MLRTFAFKSLRTSALYKAEGSSTQTHQRTTDRRCLAGSECHSTVRL